VPGASESPRIIETLAGYWKEIGLDPKITIIDYATYTNKNRTPLKTAGEVSLFRMSPGADMLSRTELYLMPNSMTTLFEDEESYAIWKEGYVRINVDERSEYVDKLNKYYYENVGPIPVIRAGLCYTWNPIKISPWPHQALTAPYYLEYVRHTQPLNTFRLFSPCLIDKTNLNLD